MPLVRYCLIASVALTFALFVVPTGRGADDASPAPQPGGIGVKIGAEGDGASYPVVMEVLPGGAAASSGIGVGDRLVGIVDDAGKMVDFQGRDMADVAALVRGPSGSTLRLVVETKGSAGRRLYELIRAGPTAEAPAAPKKSVQAPAESRLALVMGNAAYKDAPLANPVNDARDIASVLSELGFRVIMKENANRQAMRQAIREFGDILKASGGVGLFYYAGHGMQVKGRNFLVPVGEDIHAEDEVEDQSVGIDLVLEKMETANNRVNIVILDACRNNPFQRRFRSASRGLAPLDAARGSYIAFSTAPGSVAADGAGRNGVYTKHLLENLRHAESSIESVFKRVRVGVLGDTDNRQIPWESSSLTGDFFFNALQRADAAAGLAAPAPRAQDSPLALEIAYWRSIQASGNPADFDAYLKRYPQGQFADLARNRIQMLENKTRLESAGDGSAPASASGTARVHFFRESGFVGSLLTYRIEHQGKAIGNLGNGAYFSYDSPAGQQSFSAVGNFGRGGTFTFRAGQSYYIELSVVPFSASLQLVTQERGGEAIRSMR